MLQTVLIKDKKAYILTGAALKEQMPLYYPVFRDAFRSLTLTDNLTHSLPDALRREKLSHLMQEAIDKKQSWDAFQEVVLKDCQDLGPYWQILMLKSALLLQGSPAPEKIDLLKTLK